MKLLSISTASDTISISIVENQNLLDQFVSEGNKRHAELIGPETKNLLEKNNFQFSQLDGVCVNLGPGSFTGLRVGLSFAKGLVFGSKISLYGYTNFEELLLKAIYEFDVKDRCAVLIPSRKNEFYFGAFQVEGKNFFQLDSFELMTLEEIKTYHHHFEFIIVDRKLKSQIDDLNCSGSIISLNNNSYYGSLIIEQNPHKYLCENYFYLEPLYLKNFDVKLKK